ncbi:MAG: DUF6599 family protein [Thermodesulfobacteriota bacterium]
MWRCNGIIVLLLISFLFVTGNAFSEPSDIALLVPKETLDGWVAKGTPQVFTKETLFEHINGQADLFLQYGFEKSIFADYRNKDASEDKIDLDIYDMGNVLQAFGIFSRFRQDDLSAGIGLDSYLDDRYAFFYKSKYFVVLQATESNPSTLKQLARMVEARIIDNSLPPKEIAYFPKRGLKPGSIEYYPQGLIGRKFLKRGFKATYVVPDKTEAKPEAKAESPESTLFIAIFDNDEEAEAALKEFKKLLAKGASAQARTSTQHGFETAKGEDPYQGKLIVTRKGPYLLGAAGFENDKDAESLLAELSASIKHDQ